MGPNKWPYWSDSNEWLHKDNSVSPKRGASILRDQLCNFKWGGQLNIGRQFPGGRVSSTRTGGRGHRWPWAQDVVPDALKVLRELHVLLRHTVLPIDRPPARPAVLQCGRRKTSASQLPSQPSPCTGDPVSPKQPLLVLVRAEVLLQAGGGQHDLPRGGQEGDKGSERETLDVFDSRTDGLCQAPGVKAQMIYGQRKIVSVTE